MIHGPDVSGYQTKIDWFEVATISDFAIVKITEGDSGVNGRVEEQVLGAAKEGLLVMLYHFAKPNGPDWLADARREGTHLDEIADAFEQKLARKIFTILDVERNTALTPQEKPLWRQWANEIRRFCREDRDRILGWYSGLNFTRELALDSSWQNTLLYIAAYPKIFRADANYGYWPKTIAPWFRADLWQHGGGDPVAAGGNASTCPGVEGGCDFNSFAGTRAELEELIGVVA
jgi:GH25 family lysozyme M1 (1,4-beta-N-acetylmuramidase)